MKIYVASSWRNDLQPSIVAALRERGHEVYDFKNPAPGDHGFSWRECEINRIAWRDWKPSQFKAALESEPAQRGFRNDMRALVDCEACVLVLPCGRSAHLELGEARGAGKLTYVLAPEDGPGFEPELMYKMCSGICTSLEELIETIDDEAFERSRAA